ncbi:phosphotransferase family protein [Bacillus sinesaloumensis]|uniref:phosphotransferase family protein n=1 Tax=Litchfieldia sinesaloumensis TaxID=1926280 RepID=UPI00098856C5|nr:phosphotransferase family protein [Bacillus sinesaloumensis]
MEINWLTYVLGNEWEYSPAGGATGDAYFAQLNDKKIFLKRNSSPFLAVLSAEGIVPKLIWTKRLENGDVVTAQQWLSGRELKPVEMNGENVAGMLKKIHQSNELLEMLRRIGKKPIEAKDVLREVKTKLDPSLLEIDIVNTAISFLEKELNHVKTDHNVVCHSDVNHNNWLLSDKEELYLIDWDGAMIADPAVDIGMLLHWYIKKEDWPNWISLYGMELTDNLLLRMKWYVIAQSLHLLSWYYSKKKEKEVTHWLETLEQLL